MSSLKIGTVFSGIGAPEQALNKLNIDYDVVFACDNGERELKVSEDKIHKYILKNNLKGKQIQDYIEKLYLDTGKENYVEKSYKANYEVKDNDFYQDIRFLDGKKYKNKIDIFIGGSPCQSFSISGKRGGLEDTRGTLFYEYARLVKEIKPKVFIYENVPGMLSHDKGKTWNTISNVFDSLGYSWSLNKLTATDFGIPQDRTRLYVVGFRKDVKLDNEFVIHKQKLKTEVSDYLEPHVDEKYYHHEKGFKWITKPLSLEKRVSINGKIARTQAANQQFNWCGDMRFEPLSKRKFGKDIYIGKFNGKEGVARKLTPRECLRLMGFSDDFKIVVPDNKMYRQSGNSIVVNVLESIFQSIMDTGIFE